MRMLYILCQRNEGFIHYFFLLRSCGVTLGDLGKACVLLGLVVHYQFVTQFFILCHSPVIVDLSNCNCRFHPFISFHIFLLSFPSSCLIEPITGSIKSQGVMHDGEMTNRTPQSPPSSEMNFEEVALG